MRGHAKEMQSLSFQTHAAFSALRAMRMKILEWPLKP
jgi:hypothetical protein